MNANLYQCPSGHQQYLPYRADALSTWCEPCRQMCVCSRQQPQTVATPGDAVDSLNVIQGKFRDLAATWDASRMGRRVHLVPAPKDDAERDAVCQLTGLKFPSRHIATLPHMDADGLNDARAVAQALQGPGPAAVLLWGDYGTGKTQVATAVAKMRLERGHRTRYVLAPALLRMLKDNFKTRVPEEEILRRYHECAGLVVDEIQAALDAAPGETSWARTQLQSLVDARYSTRRPLKTILICNADSEDALRQRIGAHILSRAQECGKVLRVARRNYRGVAARLAVAC